MFNKRCFLTLWFTISFFASAQVVFGQITLSQPVAIAQKTVPKRAVAIITFENLSAFPDNDWVGASFAESLTTKLSKLESLDLYERHQLHTVIVQSGLDQHQVSEAHWEKVEQIGSTLRLKGVGSVLIGSVAMMGSDENPETPLQVNARTVNVETGAITRGEAFSVQGKFSQLFDLQTLLAQQFVSALGVKPTSEEEQQMQERETESLAAYRLYILGIQYLDEGKYSEAKAAFWEAAKPANFPAALLAWEKASEQEILERERTGARDEAMRSALTTSARELASQGAVNIYVLGMANEFNGRYDEAIDAYKDFLKYTQSKVLRWKYQTKYPIKIGLGNPEPRQYPPVISDGVVYIVDGEALYALENTTGRLLWKVAMDASQPVVKDGTLYVSDRGKGILYALNAKSGDKLWQSELGVKLGRNPIVAGDMVYVWSNNNPMETPDARNILYALSRADGALLWKHDIGARRGYSSPITVSEGIVYLLSTAPPTLDKADNSWRGADFCTLSALDGTSGKLLWESEVKVAYSRECDNHAQIDYAPVVSDGVVYAVGLDAYLYALAGKSGQVQWRSEVKYLTGSFLEFAEWLREKGTGVMKWRSEMVKSSTGFLPIVSGGVVYVPCDINLVPSLYMFDAQSGARRGQLDIGKKGEQWRDIDYSIIVADGVIYARFSTGWNVDKAKTLYAFDLESGAQLWQYYVARGISSPLSFVDGVLYFTAEDGKNLYALNGKSGKLLWKYELEPGPPWGAYPTIVDDFIYISAGSALYALSVSGASPLTAPSDLDAQVAIGRALWMKGELQSAKTMLRAVLEAKPNVTAAWVLLAEISEGLGENTEAIQSWLRVNEYAPPVDEDSQKSLRHLGELVGLQWRFKPYPAYSSNARQVTATKGRVYVQGWNFLYILERETGKLLEKHEDGKVFPSLAEGMVYVHYGGKLYAVEAQTDRVLWTYDIRFLFEALLKQNPLGLEMIEKLPESVKEEMYSARIQDAYVFNQTLFILSFQLHALSAKSGELLWKSEPRSGRFLYGFAGMIYTVSSGFSADGHQYERLDAISSETGELLWTYEIRQRYPEEDSSAYFRLASPRPLAVSKEAVYVATGISEPMGMNSSRAVGGVLLALDRATGALLWKYEMDKSYIKVRVGLKGIVYVDVESYTLALDGKSGELLWKQDGAFDLISENVIYGRYRNGIMAVDAQSGDVLWRFSGDGAREFHGDSFLSEGVLYTVSDMGGILYALDAATGMPIWVYDMGDRFLTGVWEPVSSLLTVADGVLYIHSRDGGVYAIDITQASVKLPPSPKLMAINYMERGRYAEAIESGQQAIAKDPSDASVLNILGRAYWKTGQTQQALSAFQQVLTLEQQGDAAANAWGGISEIAQSEIEPEIFLEFCNKLASTAPEDAEFQIKRRLLLSEFHRSRGDLEAAEKEYAKTGFPKESDWVVIGPFDNTEDKGRTFLYPPETEINLSATYLGKAGTVQWQKADDGQMNGRLDFTKIFTPTEWVLAYALIDVVSPDDREAQLRIGSDDGVKVWLNGQVVWTNQVPRGLRLDEDVVPIALKKGTNRLLFKVDNGVVAWELAVRITDASGQPLEGLRFQAPE